MALFIFNDDYDAEYASDGVSRYGAYLRQSARRFGDGYDDFKMTCDPVQFVRSAWEIAQSPIMTPAYLSWDAPRLQSVACSFSDHDDSLIVAAALAVPRPEQLRDLHGFQEWDRGDSFGTRGYNTPYDSTLARRPALLTSAQLRLSVAAGDLYEPQDAPGQLTVTDAKAAVRALARVLTGHLEPVLAALDTTGTHSRRGGW